MFGFLKKQDQRNEQHNHVITDGERALNEFDKRQAQIKSDQLNGKQTDYRDNREFIIMGVRAKLDDPDFDLEGANSNIALYQEVASDDNDFQRLLQCVQIAEAYDQTAENDQSRKLQLCNAFLSREPQNQRFKKHKLRVLKDIFETLSENQYNEKLAICAQITDLDPNDTEYKRKREKLKKICEKEAQKRAKEQLELAKKAKKQREKAAALATLNDSIGGHTHCPVLKGDYNSSLNDVSLPLRTGKVTVRIHTHGLSIFPAYVNSLDINYRDIAGLSCETQNDEASWSLAGAAIGAIFGGIFGALAGGAAGAVAGSSKPFLCIQYKDKYSPVMRKITIQANKEEEIHQFIANYYHEIEITQRTGRSPSGLRNTLMAIGKGTLKLVGAIVGIGLIFAILLAIATPSHHPTPIDKTPSVSTEIDNKQVTATPEPTKQTPSEPATHSKNWNALNDTQCSLKSSAGTLTLSKASGNAAILEVTSNAIHDGSNELNIAFDRSKPLSLMGSVDGNTIKINVDKTFLQKMRQGTTMKMSLPGASSNKETKPLKFTLMGFSQACPWSNAKQDVKIEVF